MNSNVAVTPAGLIVPADVVDAVVADARQDGKPDTAAALAATKDPDGRRRVVLTADEKKQLDKTSKMLKALGLGVVVGCKNPDCNQILTMEGVNPQTGARDPDFGYGCKCTRIHFQP